MLPDNHITFYCDGEQHQLFPGVDLNCVEACDDACPDDCCDKASCCDEEECLQSCDMLCDGFVNCDHPPGCSEQHCKSPECNEENEVCFDENCLLNMGSAPTSQVASRKKRRLEHSSNFDLHDVKAIDVSTNMQTSFVATPQDFSDQFNIHEPACFGHNETCLPGCVNPTHLHLKPSLCHHLPLTWAAYQQPQCVTPDSLPNQGTHPQSPYQPSVESTPYLTHSESRPSTACSVHIDFNDSILPGKVAQCCCIDTNGRNCGQFFTDPGSLNQHILDFHVSKTKRGNDEMEGFFCCWFDCSRHLNNQPFTSVGKIESHYLSHSGHKGFKCEICGRIYAREGSLDRHRQTHSKDKMYKCHICGKTTTDKNQLKIHIRSHTGEKPYKCDFPGCNHRASDSTNMTKHKKTHQPRQYYCPFPGCNRTFVRSDGLRRHMKTCKAGKDFEKAVDESWVGWPEFASTKIEGFDQHAIPARQSVSTVQ